MSVFPDYKNLAEQLNTTFTLLDSAQSLELKLVEITAPTVTTNQTYFSLYFLGAKEFMLPQGTYRLRHEKFGETMFFLVPTALDDEGFKYESVFNLLNELNTGT